MIFIQPFKRAVEKIDKLHEDFPFEFKELKAKDDLEDAYDAKRKQYLAYDYLSQCQRIGEKHNKIVLGITDVDLFVPMLNFVFGLGEKNGHGCVIY